jgi:hypothetical protein
MARKAIAIKPDLAQSIKVISQVESSIWLRVYNQSTNQSRRQVDSEIDTRVRNQVERQARNRVWHQISEDTDGPRRA